MKYIALEHHPNDSRLRVINEDVCQTLSSRMGTGGGNVPLVLEVNDGSIGNDCGSPDSKDM